jgi:hypothetical protein
VLARAKTPLGKSEVGRRAELNASGVRRTISQLIETGIVEVVGVGRGELVRLRREHPLAAAVEALFAAEADRYEGIIDGLGALVRRIGPPPRAAWIEGGVAAETDEPGDPIVVGVLASAGRLESALEQLEAGLDVLELEGDVTITVRGWTSADLGTLPEEQLSGLDRVIPLLGPSPEALMPQARVGGAGAIGSRTHEEVDRRLLELARAIAERLSSDPSLIDRAREYVSRRMKQASPQERKELEEWDRLLGTMSLPRLKGFLVDPGERAARMRQTLPFLNVLSEEERRKIFEEAAS